MWPEQGFYWLFTLTQSVSKVWAKLAMQEKKDKSRHTSDRVYTEQSRPLPGFIQWDNGGLCNTWCQQWLQSGTEVWGGRCGVNNQAHLCPFLIIRDSRRNRQPRNRKVGRLFRESRHKNVNKHITLQLVFRFIWTKSKYKSFDYLSKILIKKKYLQVFSEFICVIGGESKHWSRGYDLWYCISLVCDCNNWGDHRNT